MEREREKVVFFEPLCVVCNWSNLLPLDEWLRDKGRGGNFSSPYKLEGGKSKGAALEDFYEKKTRKIATAKVWENQEKRSRELAFACFEEVNVKLKCKRKARNEENLSMVWKLVQRRQKFWRNWPEK